MGSPLTSQDYEDLKDIVDNSKNIMFPVFCSLFVMLALVYVLSHLFFLAYH